MCERKSAYKGTLPNYLKKLAMSLWGGGGGGGGDPELCTIAIVLELSLYNLYGMVIGKVCRDDAKDAPQSLSGCLCVLYECLCVLCVCVRVYI